MTAAGSALSFRPLLRSDFDLLARWLAEPTVKRWWNHEHTPEALNRDFGAEADGSSPTRVAIVLLAGRPVGLIQYYRFHDYPEYVEEMSAVMEIPVDAGGIDYLIGEPDCRGRSLGTAMIGAFVERLWVDDPELGSLIVPVTTANLASWRALAGSGFVKVADAMLEPDNPVDDGRHVIMVMERPSPAD